MDIVEGTWDHGLPYYSFGAGDPLVVLRWFTAEHSNPKGLERRLEHRILEPLAKRFEVFAVNRAPGMPAGTTMADIADQHATAIRRRFGTAVHVLGMSSGGSLALQLAADHPDVVRKLVVAGAAATLTPQTREVQRAHTEANAAGHRGAQFQAQLSARTPLRRAALSSFMWLMDPYMRPRNPSDMLHFAQAEDSFDVRDRLATIHAPTLVIGGEDDLSYTLELFRETAEGLPDARLILYPRTGHMGTFKRFGADVIAFLTAR